MAKTKPFDEHQTEYENWFIQNKWAYLSELKALEKIVPENMEGIEIGMGSGLFAEPLQIKTGIEPSAEMRRKAEERGLQPSDAVAENIPFPDNKFDFALMVTTICFVDDPQKALQETHRILKNDGYFIIGFVDKNSPVGRIYLENKNKSLFYQDAKFFSSEEIISYLKDLDFEIETIYQTIFGKLTDINEVQEPKRGLGEGSFVVIKARKMGGKNE